MISDLPFGWTRQRLGEIAKIGNGSTPSRNEPRYWQNGTHAWLPTSKVHDRIINKANEFITATALKECSIKVYPAGSVLLGMIGQGKTRGTAAYLAIDASINQNFACVMPCQDLDSWYLFHFLEHSYWQLRNFSHGSNQGALNCALIGQFPIDTPPLAEQRKIADILNTWDKAIALTERLVAATQKRKQVLMQQLLTGERRFKEFGEAQWDTYEMGNLLEEVKRPVEWSDDQIYSLISIRRRSGGLFLRERLKGKDIKTKKMNVARNGDFLISRMQVVHGASGLTTDEFDGMHISGSYVALVARDSSQLNIEFFDWLSRMPFMYRLALASSYGVHIEKMTFNLSDYFRQKIRIPCSIEEQNKIISVLNSAESEIKLLTKKADLLKQQKKGLMQRLLTGKVRVKTG